MSDTPSYTVVIPSTEPQDDILTLHSVPDSVETHVVGDDYTLNEARNEGVRRASTDIIAIMDDDLVFDPELLDSWAARIDTKTLLGLADWDYGWIAGRVMVFHRRLWKQAGGFDERLASHMGDTKYSLDVLAAGGRLERIPREVVYHEPHDRTITAWDHVWRGLYLATQHPAKAPHIARRMIA